MKDSIFQSPTVSLWNLTAPIIFWSIALLTWLITQYVVANATTQEIKSMQLLFSILYFLTFIFIISGFIMPLPFLWKREINITKNKITGSANADAHVGVVVKCEIVKLDGTATITKKAIAAMVFVKRVVVEAQN